MSARSLRSGIIKTGDSIHRATRRNTILYKTENGFQQARQIQKRHTLSLPPACPPPKRKRKESPLKKQENTQSQLKQNENISSIVDKPQKKDVPIQQPENEISTDTSNEMGYTMKREPRMASLNAIAKVNAVLDSFNRAENKNVPDDSAIEGSSTVCAVETYSSEGKESDKEMDSEVEAVKDIESDEYATKEKDTLSLEVVNIKEIKNIAIDNCVSKEKDKLTTNIENTENIEVNENVICLSKEKVTLSTHDMNAIASECIEKDNCATKEKDTPSMDVVNIKESKMEKKDIVTTDIVNIKTSNVTENDKLKKKHAQNEKDNCTEKRTETSNSTIKDVVLVKITPLNVGNKGTNKSKVKTAEGKGVPIIGKSSSNKATSKEECTVNKDIQTCTNKISAASHSKEQTTCPNHQPMSKVDSKIEVVIQTCNDNTSEVSDSESVPYDMSSPESGKEIDDDNANNEIEMSDQAIQTDINDKSMQTDVKHLPNVNNKRLCTCKIESESTPAISHYSPMNQEYLTKPFYVKSTVLAHTNNHTLVVPLAKRHVLKEKENEYRKPRITNNISTLLDACINNTLLQNNVTCSKLVYLANYKEKSVILNTPNIDWKKDYPKPTKTVDNSHLNVPQVKFGSVPDEKGSSTDKNNSKVVSTKQKIKSPPGRRKKCNGWQFEGDPMEEPYTLGNQVITRRHYESIYRNKEVLQIHDAVMLKSGLGKQDADYVARISMFWEDLTGPYAGDMMMSIYWYYNPEQTNFKFPETSKMEVYASRHRDDNSVACIVEKCFVISFTQFCRFQAQKMLLKEKCKKKLKVVPEDKNVRSRFLPSPDVDESIVYFCRYGYEYRCGKLIKGL